MPRGQATPWDGLMTIPALPILAVALPTEVRVMLGSRAGMVGTLNRSTNRIEVTVPDRGTQQMSPYRFSLSRWTGRGVPCLRTHPLAILHLLVSGQCDRTELLEAIPLFPPGKSGVIMPILRPCELLGMLGVQRANLGFATTTNDFNVGQSPSS